MIKVLLLEDDILLKEIVQEYLEQNHFDVTTISRADTALDLAYEKNFDILLLDVKVPYGDGFSLLSSLRDADKKTPAIFMTSLSSVEDMTKGYDSGCDDYIKKPFELKELLLRINSIIKKTYSQNKQQIQINPKSIFDILNQKLYIDGKEVHLANKELLLLKYFLANKNKIINREDLLDYLWEYEKPSEMSLRVYIRNLRKLLGHKSIETRKNIGYVFCLE